jgi:hypothetical protein
MTTNKADVAAPVPVAHGSGAPAPPSPQASGARLIVLLGLLAVVIGAYVYDFVVARPGCEATEKKIQEFVDARNKMGVKEGSMVTPADLHKELGMEPTWVDKHDKDKQQYLVEYYCWWGHVPLINMRRHFISVVYTGHDPNWRFSSHHRELPPDEALPIVDDLPAKDDGPLPMPESAGAGSSGGEKAAAKGTDEAPSETKEAPPAPPAKEE